MKRSTIIAILSFISILLLTGCRRDNLGWPTKVSFEKDGGEKIVEPEYNDTAYALFIIDGTSTIRVSPPYTSPEVIVVSPDDEDPETLFHSTEELTFQYKWLTITVKNYFQSMKLKAEPNTTGQPRSLKLRAMIMNSGFVLTVEQKG